MQFLSGLFSMSRNANPASVATRSESGDLPPCTLIPVRERFEVEKVLYESVLLTFKGVDGFDVYNCSVPFRIGGVEHIWGRVERREEWVNSFVRLFKRTGEDEFTVVPEAITWQLEDPYVSKIHDQMLFGGTRVTKNHGKVSDYHCDFFRGTHDNLRYFTGGPKRMKDIRLVQLKDGKIGIFSHHKTHNHCKTGWNVIDSLDDLSAEAIDAAKPIDHTLFGDAWGGVNQAYLLDTGKIGCISHHGYLARKDNGVVLNVYCLTSFVFEPDTNMVYSFKILGTKNCFPECPAKVERLEDCAFVSGIVMREDGRADLYSGVGDTHEGRMVVDYPFEGHGSMVRGQLDFE